MEVVRERFAEDVIGKTIDKQGRAHAIIGPEHKVGEERFEFNMPGDAMSMVIGGGYQANWNPDFLQRELSKEGTCARLYFDKKVAVDIGDPEDAISKKKRRLLFKHGFGYMCIPSGFAQDVKRLKSLYNTAVEEYYDYEKRHPRPAVFQETTIIDEKGNHRRALLTARDIRVGGGITGSEEKQAAELKKASKLSNRELRLMKLTSKLRKRLRRSIQSNTPFRNPFIKKNKRLFPVEYRVA